jgi:hypothetical protein
MCDNIEECTKILAVVVLDVDICIVDIITIFIYMDRVKYDSYGFINFFCALRN